MKYKVAMTDSDFESLAEIIKPLDEIGAEFVVGQCKNEDDVISLAKDADAVISHFFNPISRRVIEQLTGCKVIARTGIGVDTIDIEAASERNICVVNVPSYCIDEVTEHAPGMLSALARRICQSTDTIKRHRLWDWNSVKPLFPVKGKTLGTVGLGKIARALVKKATGLEMRLVKQISHLHIDFALLSRKLTESSSTGKRFIQRKRRKRLCGYL